MRYLFLRRIQAGDKLSQFLVVFGVLQLTLMKGDKVIERRKIGTYTGLFLYIWKDYREVNKDVLIKMLDCPTSSFLINIVHKKRCFQILKKVLTIYFFFILYFNIEDTSVKCRWH